MHRFRKRSDAKRGLDLTPGSDPHSPDLFQLEPEGLPELPPESNFRISLILPDLSRRFSLLRTATGDPIPLEGLKSRLASQRARGAKNQITEEEEDMILQTLGQLTSRNTDTDRSAYNSTSSTEADSSDTMAPISPSSSGGRRNLFGGSARFQDYNYVRSVTSQRSIRSNSSATPTDASQSVRGTLTDSLRPVTPDSSMRGPSNPSTPSDRAISPSHHSVSSTNSYIDHPISVAEYRLSKALGTSGLKRASLAFDEAIKELEEEVEEEIVLPRLSSHRGDERKQSVTEREPLYSNYAPGMAISSDHLSDVEDHRVSPRASPLPSQVLPGYIPGMPRPMTPRLGIDTDELRSHSTTPRAGSSAPSLNLAMGAIKKEHEPASPYSHRSGTSSSTGRFTPDGLRDVFTSDFDDTLTSSILGRRRPASPLSGTPYQPMAVSSRPGTPSNVTWEQSSKNSGHSRNGSWFSDGGMAEADDSVERMKSTTRSLRSPALPDSPLFDHGQSSVIRSQTSNTHNHSPMASLDLGSPASVANRILRSPTPNQLDQRSPTSPTFPQYDKSTRNGVASNKPSPRQTTASPFSFGSFNPFGFSSFDNSSRSSLGSDGSSYHSRDDGSADASLALFTDNDGQQAPWHDLSGLDGSTTNTSADSHLAQDAEETMKRCAGLLKADFFAIQERLVNVAAARSGPTEARERVPSLRRRRPSTSQSNYSVNGRDRIASPGPNISRNRSPSPAPDPSHKTAILDSIVDSVQSSPAPLIIPQNTPAESTSDPSPTSRRNRDLAKVLFGHTTSGDEMEDSRKDEVVKDQTDYMQPMSTVQIPDGSSSGDQPKSSPVIPTSPYLLLRSTSTTKIPQLPQDQEELAKEVQRKTTAAMDALNKNASTTKLHEVPGGTIPKKRITLKHISNPQFVSSSTSLETIPLPTGPAKQSRMSQRIKKLRGTLRTKPPLPNGEEVTPFPLELQSMPSATTRAIPTQSTPTIQVQTAQTAQYLHPPLRSPNPIPMSATEQTASYKYPIPSPPASAGPGLKSFIMSRFRGKQRLNEGPEQQSFASQLHSFSTPSGLPSPGMSPPYETSPVERRAPTPSQGSSPNGDTSSQSWLPMISDSSGEDAQALQQLFEAASHFGLDQEAVSDLLARKASTASRSTTLTNLTRSNTAASAAGRTTVANESVYEPPQPSTIRSLSLKKRADTGPRAPREGGNATAASNVVRRTIIFPSETRASTFDINALVRKTSKSRKRSSAQSLSNRSITDRAPTPPPPRSPTSKRFSGDNSSPPVPQLPTSLSSASESFLRVPNTHAGGSVEKSSSAYESLYDMYTEESKGVNNSAPAEAGPAIEVIELANGQTIWSIVNGLRDDDMESTYDSRNSFASQYSAPDVNGDLQVFVKEHARSGSRGSASSFLSRKKTHQGANRPETKVFYSSPAHIGRLIENLSEGMDAGSFKFSPGPGNGGHSNVSSLSDAHWTVEERLDHMLGAMQRHAS